MWYPGKLIKKLSGGEHSSPDKLIQGISEEAAIQFVQDTVVSKIPFKVFVHRRDRRWIWVRRLEDKDLTPYGYEKGYLSPYEKLWITAYWDEDEQRFVRMEVEPGITIKCYDEEWNVYAKAIADELIKYGDVELYLFTKPKPLPRRGRLFG